MTLSDETVTQVTPGIIATDDGYQCLQCGNIDKRYMYEYETPFQKNVLFIVGIVYNWGVWTILQNLGLRKVRIYF